MRVKKGLYMVTGRKGRYPPLPLGLGNGLGTGEVGFFLCGWDFLNFFKTFSANFCVFT